MLTKIGSICLKLYFEPNEVYALQSQCSRNF